MYDHHDFLLIILNTSAVLSYARIDVIIVVTSRGAYRLIEAKIQHSWKENYVNFLS